MKIQKQLKIITMDKNSINFLMGQVMRLTRGKADPGELLKY